MADHTYILLSSHRVNMIHMHFNSNFTEIGDECKWVYVFVWLKE